MLTRKPLKPRMTGRLAPGANVVAAMPGLVANASPRVGEGWLSSWPGVTTVTGAKVWSGEISKGVPARSGTVGCGLRRPAAGGLGVAGAGGATGAWRRHGDAGQLDLGLGIAGGSEACPHGQQRHKSMPAPV